MKKLIFITILFINNYCLATNNNDHEKKYVIISGTISNSIASKLVRNPCIEFYNDYNQRIPANKEIISIKLVNNQFKINLFCKGEFAYFKITNTEIPIRTTSNFMFLVRAGDSVHIKICDKGQVKFTGDGSDKLNYQHWAGNLSVIPSKSWKSINDPAIILYNKQYIGKKLSLVTDSLNIISSTWEPTMTKIILYNTVSNINQNYLNGITRFLHLRYDSTYLTLLKNEIDFIYSQQNSILCHEDSILQYSFLYTLYLTNLNKVYAQIHSDSITFPFAKAFEIIKNKYSGHLRDRMLVELFLSRSSKDVESLSFLTEAEQLISNQSSLEILKKMELSKIVGSQAFNFLIKGVNGEPLTLNDFKGKILIIDTYYYGCTFCALLTERMKPIMKYFNNRSDVVFMSLDALDTDVRKFKESVKSGKYGGYETVYAHTDGLGARHPMILFYNYTGYPNQLIIGKNGKVISANPPNPNDAIKTKEFIRLIESNL